MFATVFLYRLAKGQLGIGLLVAGLTFALVSLKYLLFDSLIRMARRRWPRLKVLPWLWIGYAAAVSLDIAATWIAVSDESGATLALAWTVIVSPWLLAGALVAMLVHTLTTRKRAKQ